MLSPEANGMMVVESEALASADPPPCTLTWLSCGEAAVPATLTVTVIDGYEVPPGRDSLREQLFAAQVQPLPLMDTSDNPDGSVSVTVIVPVVLPAPA